MASTHRPQAGDKVSFHFKVTGERRMRIRDAVLTRVYPEANPDDEGDPPRVEHGDLEVAITEAEEQLWGYARIQRSKAFADGRRPVSGDWTRLVY